MDRFNQLPWMETSSLNRLFIEIVDGVKQSSKVWGVIGPHGAGKTRLLKEISQSLTGLDGHWVGICDAKEPDAFSNIARALGESGLPIHVSNLERIVLMLKQRHALGQKTVLLIDNAEYLSIDLLSDLLKAGEWHLTEGQERQYRYRFNLVLSSSSLNFDVLSKIEHQCRVFTIVAMSAFQVKRFAQYALVFLGKKVELSDEENKQLFDSSHGYPGRILHELTQLPSLKMESESSKKSKHFLSSKHVIVLVIVLLLISLILWIASQESQQNVQQQITDALIEETSENSIEAQRNRERSFVEPELDLSVNTEPATMSLPENVVAAIILDEEIANGSDMIGPPLPPNNQTSENRDSTKPSKEALSTSTNLSMNEQPKNVEPIRVELAEEAQRPLIERENVDVSEQNDTEVAELGAFIIRLSEAQTKAEAERKLRGANIPGGVKFSRMNHQGITVWVGYLGPYSSRIQAEKGAKVLPSSVQRLKPEVYSDATLTQ